MLTGENIENFTAEILLVPCHLERKSSDEEKRPLTKTFIISN